MCAIREMTAADAGALAALDLQCFSMPWSERSFADEVENPIARYFVACDDGGKIIGYAGYWRVGDEADITNVAVAENMRRRGIASALLEKLVRLAGKEGLLLMTLEVRKSNAPARALYERFGFEALGERKSYYINPREDAVIMTLGLGEM